MEYALTGQCSLKTDAVKGNILEKRYQEKFICKCFKLFLNQTYTLKIGGPAPFMIKMSHRCKTEKKDVLEGTFYHKYLNIRES